MKNKTRILGYALPAVYLLLCSLSFAYYIYRHSSDKFSAIFIVALTLPWSFVIFFLKDVVGLAFDFDPTYVDANIVLVILVFVNTVLIFRVSAGKRGARQKPERSDNGTGE